MTHHLEFMKKLRSVYLFPANVVKEGTLFGCLLYSDPPSWSSKSIEDFYLNITWINFTNTLLNQIRWCCIWVIFIVIISIFRYGGLYMLERRKNIKRHPDKLDFKQISTVTFYFNELYHCWIAECKIYCFV